MSPRRQKHVVLILARLCVDVTAEKLKITPGAMWQRYVRGKFPNLKLRRISSSKVMVVQ